MSQQKTELTITVRLDLEALNEAKRVNGGEIKYLIGEALSDVFNTTVEAIKWSAKYEKVEE